mgnify:CR=1 FL=1
MKKLQFPVKFVSVAERDRRRNPTGRGSKRSGTSGRRKKTSAADTKRRTDSSEKSRRREKEEELRAAMEFQHRPKQRTKRLVKKMLGRPVAPLVTENQQTEQPVSSCVGSIDSFSYENNVLQIIGWAFDRAYAMENTHLGFFTERGSGGGRTDYCSISERCGSCFTDSGGRILWIFLCAGGAFTSGNGSGSCLRHRRRRKSISVMQDPADPGCNEIQVYTWRDRRASAIFDILKNVIWKKRRYLMRRFLRMK